MRQTSRTVHWSCVRRCRVTPLLVFWLAVCVHLICATITRQCVSRSSVRDSHASLFCGLLLTLRIASAPTFLVINPFAHAPFNGGNNDDDHQTFQHATKTLSCCQQRPASSATKTTTAATKHPIRSLDRLLVCKDPNATITAEFRYAPSV